MAKMREFGVQVMKGFASVEEQKELLEELESSVFKKLKYEKGHWDNVISNYRETEKMKWNNGAVFERMKALFPQDWPWRPAVHVLDLLPGGEIKGHVDNVSEVVVGLSLLSPSVMRFESEDESFSLLLLPGSLYIMASESRYAFKHSILLQNQRFDGKTVEKGRRISLMLRDTTNPNIPEYQ